MLLIPFIVCAPILLTGPSLICPSSYMTCDYAALLWVQMAVLRSEVLSSTQDRHEAYLQLKEIEYGQLFNDLASVHVMQLQF